MLYFYQDLHPLKILCELFNKFLPINLGERLLNHLNALMLRDVDNCCNFSFLFVAIVPHSVLKIVSGKKARRSSQAAHHWQPAVAQQRAGAGPPQAHPVLLSCYEHLGRQLGPHDHRQWLQPCMRGPRHQVTGLHRAGALPMSGKPLSDFNDEVNFIDNTSPSFTFYLMVCKYLAVNFLGKASDCQ